MRLSVLASGPASAQALEQVPAQARALAPGLGWDSAMLLANQTRNSQLR
jgi:hypothetical protein